MKNKYLKSKCGYDMQGENQNTEKSRITERQKLEIQTARNWKSGLQETGSPERKKIEVRTARIWMEVILR